MFTIIKQQAKECVQICLELVSRKQFDCINEVIRVAKTQSETADYWQVPNTFNALKHQIALHF
ncbi:MAG: hypothetical protein ACJAWQ_001996 [Paraglaciecola sp.]